MSKSNIIIRTRYKHSLTASKHISKWVDYVSKKEKADATSLDDKNIMNEYFALANKDSFLYEKCESFVWGQDGDINPKQDLPKVDDTGFVWNLVISFPPDFAIKNGLISRVESIHRQTIDDATKRRKKRNKKQTSGGKKNG